MVEFKYVLDKSIKLINMFLNKKTRLKSHGGISVFLGPGLGCTSPVIAIIMKIVTLTAERAPQSKSKKARFG